MPGMLRHSPHQFFAPAQNVTKSSANAAARLNQRHPQRIRPLSPPLPASRNGSVAEAAPSSEVPVAIRSFPTQGPSKFINGLTSFVDEHRVRGHEVGADQKATMVTVAHILQEAAGNHAVGMWGRSGGGFANSPSMGDLIFVMTRLQIRVKQYPQWGQTVQTETWFQEEGRLSARRDYIVRNTETNEELVVSTSTWVCINMATRRLSKLPDKVRADWMRLAPDPPRSAIPKEETKKKLPDLPEAVGPAELLDGCAIKGVDVPQEDANGVVRQYRQARYSAIDMNGHVNNVAYLSWALDTVPAEIMQSHSLQELELEFKAECQAGDIVESIGIPLSSPSSNGASPSTNGASPHNPNAPLQFLHSLWLHPAKEDSSDSSTPQKRKISELVRARTTWIIPPAAASENGAHTAATNGVHTHQ